MVLPEVIVPLYHVDTISQNEKFIAGAFWPSKEDGKWCGRGMYFWDNLANAEYWGRDWQRRKKSEFSVATASLVCQERDILDLTDQVVSQQMVVTARKLSRRYNIEIDFRNNGEIVNFLYSVLEREASHRIFKVVKLAAYYPRAKTRGLIADNEKDSIRPQASAKVKIIYAVRHNDLITRREVLFNGQRKTFWLFSI